MILRSESRRPSSALQSFRPSHVEEKTRKCRGRRRRQRRGECCIGFDAITSDPEASPVESRRRRLRILRPQPDCGLSGIEASRGTAIPGRCRSSATPGSSRLGPEPASGRNNDQVRWKGKRSLCILDGVESPCIPGIPDPHCHLTAVLTLSQDRPFAKALVAYILNKSPSNPNTHSALQALLGPAGLQSQNHVGFVFSERLVNMPVQLMPPMYRMLSEELQWATDDVSNLI